MWLAGNMSAMVVIMTTASGKAADGGGVTYVGMAAGSMAKYNEIAMARNDEV